MKSRKYFQCEWYNSNNRVCESWRFSVCHRIDVGLEDVLILCFSSTLVNTVGISCRHGVQLAGYVTLRHA